MNVPVVVAWIFEIRLLFSLLKSGKFLQLARVRRTLTSHLGRGSFVLISQLGIPEPQQLVSAV